LAALLHGTQASGVSQTLQHGTRNGITELSQRAPPVFCWAAITLGIGPHSSFLVKCHQLFILLFLQTRSVCIYVFVSFVIFAYFIAATLVK